MEGPALADCGQEIGVGGVADTVNFTPGGGRGANAVVELVGNCDVGVQVAISGPNFKIVGAIRTKDGAYQSSEPLFRSADQNGTLTVSQHGRRLGQMTVLSPDGSRPAVDNPISATHSIDITIGHCRRTLPARVATVADHLDDVPQNVPYYVA